MKVIDLLPGMWKQKCWKRLNFCGSGNTLMKEVGSGSELGSESVEKELEAEAIFSKSGASGFSTWLQPLGKCYNNNNNIESTTRAWYGMEWNENLAMEFGRCQNGKKDFANEMEDNLPYFHTNSILDFVHCINRKIHTDVGW